MKMIHGKIWTFGDGIDTDIIIPARHLVLPMEEMKQYAMEPMDPEFAGKVRPGDMMVAGSNFGCGSSREQAPAVLKALGIQAIVAKSFARIFFRNAINLGLVVVECPDIIDHVQTGDMLEIHPASGRLMLPEHGLEFTGSRLPEFLMEIVAAGGLIAHLAQKG
jgi:3-isopropylmalate/(R)-2-methylmalate dehydratase small subunit